MHGRGQLLDRDFDRLDREVRANKIRPSDHISVSRGLSGISIQVNGEEADDGRNVVGVITADIAACTGGSGTFTPGTGTMELYRRDPSVSANWIATGTTYTAYNSLPVIVPAQDKLAQFKWIDGVLWVDVAACDDA